MHRLQTIKKRQNTHSITGGKFGKSWVVFDKSSYVSPCDRHQLHRIDKVVNDTAKQLAIATRQCCNVLLKQMLLLGFVKQLCQSPAVIFVQLLASVMPRHIGISYLKPQQLISNHTVDCYITSATVINANWSPQKYCLSTLHQ